MSSPLGEPYAAQPCSTPGSRSNRTGFFVEGAGGVLKVWAVACLVLELLAVHLLDQSSRWAGAHFAFLRLPPQCMQIEEATRRRPR